jgi:transcriptional regulator with XRE-family HTH domain
MSDAGRPGTDPADPAAGALLALSTALKELRKRSGTLAALAEKTGKSKTAISTATNGRDLPSWKLTLLITRACGGDEDEIKELWKAAANSAGRRIPPELISKPPPDPSAARDASEFIQLLDDLRQWAGLSFQALNHRAVGHNTLPASSVHDMIRRGKQGRLPQLEKLRIYCQACGLDADQINGWVQVLDTLKSVQLENAEADTAAATARPISPASNRLARAFRSLAGVDEDLLDQVPQERVRYTVFGITIANAALLTMAGAALASVMAFGPSPLIIGGAALLGVLAGLIQPFYTFVIITNNVGITDSRRRRYWSVLPQIGLSIIMSLLIAEGLLLAVFHPAVKQRAQSDRSQQLALYETRLRNCNPVTPVPTFHKSCAGYSVISDAAAELQAQLSPLKQQRASLQQEITYANDKITAAEETARLECNGGHGQGTPTTGIAGEGPLCKQRRTEADQIRIDSHLDQKQGQIVDIDSKITNIAGGLSKYIAQTITRKVETRRVERVGILQQEQALNAMSDTVIWTTSWAIRLGIVLMIILPLLLAGGMADTEYAKVFRTTRASALRAAAAEANEKLQAITDLTDEISEHLARLSAQATEQIQTDLTGIHVAMKALQAQLAQLATTSRRGRRRQSRKPPDTPEST